MEKKVNVAVVGAGAVGVEMLRVLHQRNFPVNTLRVFARSSRRISVDGEIYRVEAIEGADFQGIDIALFAGTEGEKGAALTYAGKFIQDGAVVIDNGADFRLKEEVPLVVPEVNAYKITKHKGIIANPNCTTIQMAVSLAGIYKQFGLKQVILTSLQATSGAGRASAQELLDQSKEVLGFNKGKSFPQIDIKVKNTYKNFPRQIAFNAVAKIGSFSTNGYTSEEEKVVNETHKIFDNSSIKISATCVRVPVFTCHSESIYFSTEKNSSLEDINNVLAESPGVVFYPEPENFPVPVECAGKDEVFIGRVRKDLFNSNSFWLWSVSDNLRKGAATNAVQIAECLVKNTC